jgi:hypothetical protein
MTMRIGSLLYAGDELVEDVTVDIRLLHRLSGA